MKILLRCYHRIPPNEFLFLMATTLTKAELATRIVDGVGLNHREAKEMVELFFQEISDILVDGEDVKLSGFGVFSGRDKPARPGRNPKTGELIPVSARRVVTWHPSNGLKSAVDASPDLAVNKDEAASPTTCR